MKGKRQLGRATRICVRAGIGVALLLFLLLPWLLGGRMRQNATADLRVHIIDVGQGDALLLQTADGNILIDTGTNESEPMLQVYLDSCGVRRIDYLFVSHPHEDHIGGADMVLREYEVENFVISDLPPDADVGMELTKALLQSGAVIQTPDVGDEYLLGGLRVSVLSPPEDGFESTNDNSLVLRCEYGDISMLCMGDAESEVEAWLLESYPSSVLDCDLLKAGHHGSDTSSGLAFLRALTPRYVAISCGRGNTYNHPVQSVLDAIAAVGAIPCRTDTTGSLLFICDGEEIRLQSK